MAEGYLNSQFLPRHLQFIVYQNLIIRSYKTVSYLSL